MRCATGLLSIALLSACQAAVPFDDWKSGRDAGQPPVVVDDADAGARIVPPPEANPPQLAIIAPQAGETVDDAALIVEGTAADDTAIASVMVSVGGNSPQLASSKDGFKTWRFQGTAPSGAFDVVATARDLFGNVASATVTAQRPTGSGPDVSAPVVVISEPANNATPPQLQVLLKGTTADDVAVSAMQVRLNGELLSGQTVATDDFFATWVTAVTLTPGVVNQVELRACDAANNCGTSAVTLHGRAEVDRLAPAVTILSPTQGSALSTSQLVITGTAADNLGIREVKVRVTADGAAPGAYTQATRTLQPDNSVSWQVTLELPAGASAIEARAIDVSGLATSAQVNVTNAWAESWSAEQLIPLRINTVTSPPELRANLNRQGINEIMNETTQRETMLLALEPTPLLTNALEAIKNSCNSTSTGACNGTPHWQTDAEFPTYNCGCTALGASYGATEALRKQSPEFRLVRLLTMNPANIIVDGTSVESLKGLVDVLDNFGFPNFHVLVADMLYPSIGGQRAGQTLEGRTRTVLSVADVVGPLRNDLLASHPYLNPAQNPYVTSGKWVLPDGGAPFAAGQIPVSLYDAMHDFAPLSQHLGPAGPHPGVVDPAFTPHSNILQSDFGMLLVAHSNLRWFDGVTLGQGKDYIAINSTDGGVLDFDFEDPTRFEIYGIAPAGTADLRFRIQEDPTPATGGNNIGVLSCTGTACKNNLPGLNPRGVWLKDRWVLERIITTAALNAYNARTFDHCYWTCAVSHVAIVNPGAPAAGLVTGGWIEITTLFGGEPGEGLGDPPAPQYVWEFVDEVAQTAMHGCTESGCAFAEGTANPAFTLRNIPIGLTANGVRAAVRPSLQNQRENLSQALLGDYRQNNGDVDFYLKRGADGQRYLFFTHPSDPTRSSYSNAKPGFFGDEGLTNKVSHVNGGASGNTVHEKLLLPPPGGEVTVYAQSPAGQVYRLKLDVPDEAGADVELRVARKMQ